MKNIPSVVLFILPFSLFAILWFYLWIVLMKGGIQAEAAWLVEPSVYGSLLFAFIFAIASFTKQKRWVIGSLVLTLLCFGVELFYLIAWDQSIRENKRYQYGKVRWEETILQAESLYYCQDQGLIAFIPAEKYYAQDPQQRAKYQDALVIEYVPHPDFTSKEYATVLGHYPGRFQFSALSIDRQQLFKTCLDKQNHTAHQGLKALGAIQDG
jgi:hypothetical protein